MGAPPGGGAGQAGAPGGGGVGGGGGSNNSQRSAAGRFFLQSKTGRAGRKTTDVVDAKDASARPPRLRRFRPAAAQTGTWPTRPLRIIIPTAPGGSPDMVARTLGAKLTERLGQPVIVESVTHGHRHPGQQHGVEVGAGRAHLCDADRRLHHPGGGGEDAALPPGP